MTEQEQIPTISCCCRSDIQTECIHDLVKRIGNIHNTLHDIDLILEGKYESEMRDFKNIAHVRYYASQIMGYAENVKHLTLKLEEDLVIWGDSRKDHETQTQI